MNELEQFEQIKTSLDECKRLVNSLNKEALKDYSIIVFSGARVCNTMLTLLLQQNGYNVDRGMVIIEKDGKKSHWPVLSFGAIDRDFLPKDCRYFMRVIVQFRNQSAHSGGLNYEAAVEFSKALDYFTLWFKEYYLANANIDQELKNVISEKFFSLEKELCADLSFVEKEIGISEGESRILFMIRKQMEQFQNLTKQVGRIESKVDEIGKQIRQLSKQIISYQSLVERQIKKAYTEDEIERLISAYTDECAERIIEKTHSSSEEKILEQEKLKIISSMGKSAWNKLDETSQTFLISAKVMYNHLILLNDVIDYSGVCVLVTKALEVELSKRFYSNFIKFLDSKYQKDYTQYPTSLLDQGGKPLSLERYTMGNIAFTLCFIESRHDSLTQKANNKSKLLEYAKECIFSSYSQNQIETMLYDYAKSINTIRYKYRNPSAHTNEIKRIDAEECFNLVLDVEKLLKRMLDSFDS